MKRTRWLIVGGILLVALLAGAAYVGGRMVARGTAPGASVVIPGQVGRSEGGEVRVPARVPAPELPPAAEMVAGKQAFSRRQDRSIFARLAGEGPEIEIVTTVETKIWCDSTEVPENASADTQVQQTVVPGSLDEIGEGSSLCVWGTRSGDRIVAQVLVYSEPTILNAKPSS